MQIDNVKYRNMRLKITIQGTGTKIKTCTINGNYAATASVDVAQSGPQDTVAVLQ